MNVAVYGGAFDPPHLGHLLTVTNLLNSGKIDQVWCVPSGDKRYDKNPSVAGIHRKRMLELVIENELENNSRVKVLSTQLDSPQDLGCTVDLLDLLKKQFPQDKFYFVIGADNLSALSSWKESQRLLKENQFIVIPRLGVKVPDQVNFICLDKEPIFSCDISSSAVREGIKQGLELKAVIPHSVWEYIRKKALYK